jgi:hypothetical protein
VIYLLNDEIVDRQIVLKGMLPSLLSGLRNRGHVGQSCWAAMRVASYSAAAVKASSKSAVLPETKPEEFQVCACI